MLSSDLCYSHLYPAASPQADDSAAQESAVNHSPAGRPISVRQRLISSASGRREARSRLQLKRGEKTPRPPEGQREIQLPACHTSSAGGILGNKRARTHLCSSCRDRREGKKKTPRSMSWSELLFYYSWQTKNCAEQNMRLHAHNREME